MFDPGTSTLDVNLYSLLSMNARFSHRLSSSTVSFVPGEGLRFRSVFVFSISLTTSLLTTCFASILLGLHGPKPPVFLTPHNFYSAHISLLIPDILTDVLAASPTNLQ